MKTEEVCLACGGELKAGDLLHGRCQTCREKNIPANPKILKAQQKQALDMERTAVYRQKSLSGGRVLRPLGLSLVGLAGLLIVLFSALDDKTLDSLPYLLILSPSLIVVGGGVVFFYMNYSWFSNTAKSEGRSGFGWGIIGTLIYMVPARLFQEFIFPSLVKGRVTTETVGKYTLVSWFLAVIIGVLCALLTQRFFASRVIRRKSATNQ